MAVTSTSDSSGLAFERAILAWIQLITLFSWASSRSVGMPEQSLEAAVSNEFASILKATGPTRRQLLWTGVTGLVAAAIVSPASASDEAAELIAQLTGKMPTESARLHLVMPRTFPNGYTVPLMLEVDSAMTEDDHVRYVRVVAPRNPLIDVATFHFLPQRIQPRISTRIRLAEPQYVVAVAEMNDGALLMAKTWVEVATNGCA
jgi:sulfur-oxidizing protein SoxY